MKKNNAMIIIIHDEYKKCIPHSGNQIHLLDKYSTIWVLAKDSQLYKTNIIS